MVSTILYQFLIAVLLPLLLPSKEPIEDFFDDINLAERYTKESFFRNTAQPKFAMLSSLVEDLTNV